MKERSLMLSYAATIVILLILFVYGVTLDDAARKLYVSEGGPIDLPSAVLHFVCFALVVISGGFSYIRKYPYFALAPLLFGMRELDFDKRFTTTGIFKTRFYLRPDVPMHEKLIGGIITLALVTLVCAMIKNHFKDFVAELRQRSVLGIGAALIVTLLVIAKTLDGAARKCLSMGYHLGHLAAGCADTGEEVLELGIPILMILVFSYYFRQQRIPSGNRTH